jgi:hypothetical protein
MKKFSLIYFSIAGSLMILLAFTTIRSSKQSNGIQGKVMPVEGVRIVTAVLGRDTITAQVNNGNFKFSKIKPGTYSIIINSNLPFRDSTIVSIPVVKDATTDVGTILLVHN